MGDTFHVPPANADEPDPDTSDSDAHPWRAVARRFSEDVGDGDKSSIPAINFPSLESLGMEDFELNVPVDPGYETNDLLERMVEAQVAAEDQAREERKREHRHRVAMIWISSIGTLGAVAAAVLSGMSFWM